MDKISAGLGGVRGGGPNVLLAGLRMLQSLCCSLGSAAAFKAVIITHNVWQSAINRLSCTMQGTLVIARISYC